MALIAYSEFVDRVKRQVFPDTDGSLEPINLAFPHEVHIRNALIQAQTYLECLCENNVETFTMDDAGVNCGVAIFDLPAHIRIGAVYAYKPAKGCTRKHYEQQSVNAIMCYVDAYAGCTCTEESDICNSVRTGEDLCNTLALCEDWTGEEDDTNWLCEDKIFAKGSGDKLYVAPRIPCGYRLAVHWEGVKYRYADADLITDDPDFQDLVATYLQAQRALTIDRDLPLYKELLGNGPAKRGQGGSSWHNKLASMAHRCREERRIRTRPCLEMWDDSAVSSENIGAQLDPVPSRVETGIEFEPECEEAACAEGEYLLDGVCTECEDPTVSISASTNSIIAGTSVTLSWENTVPAIASSVVTLEYNGTVVTLDNNSSGTVVVTPTASTTYMIRAVTDCGTVIATTGIAVTAAPCLCPDGLPDCLSLDVADPVNQFSTCDAPNPDAGDASAWDGTMPRLSSCRWGIEFAPEGDNGIGGYFVNFSSGAGQFSAIIELISCDPYVYELTFYFHDLEGEPQAFWKGRCENTPVGTYVTQGWNIGISDYLCFQLENFDVQGCFETPCTPPEIRFDPPAASHVHFPTVVFLHSTNDDDNIFYSTDGEVTFQPYTGPITLGPGQQVSAYSVTLAGCPSSVVYASDYIEETNALNFEFLCDEQDEAGVFYGFYGNGSNDYHWRITITRELPWEFTRATIYETNSSGIWVTGQAWATINPIYPLEISPTAFPVYPLVLENADDPGVLINTTYTTPVENYPAGQQVLHGYGQPFIALTGYFRLELIINEGDGQFTIYKLIPHTCATEECPEVEAPLVSVECDLIAHLTATVPAGAQYRIRRTDCDGAVFNILDENISLDGNIDYEDAVEAGCAYDYLISVYCVSTGAWVDSASTQVVAPAADECDCASTDCASLQNTYYIQNTHPYLQAAVQGCSHFGDLDYNDPQWDQSYSRAGETCQWDAPSFYSYDGVYRVISDLARVVDGESCYWRIRFTGDTGAVVEYRKTSGNTPVGTYENHADPCSGEVGFPNTIAIVGETPND